MLAEMKKLFAKTVLVAVFCVFFTVFAPILLTAAQENLFSLGFGIMFFFFAVCLYLVMTSDFFKTKEELLMEESAKKASGQ